MKKAINYDLSPLNDYFNTTETPLQLVCELMEHIYNYSACVTEDNLGSFLNDVDTLYCLHSVILEIAKRAGEVDI